MALSLLAAVCANAQPDTSPAESNAARPNIVMLLADDMGYGDPSSYGHPVLETPHIDRLAKQGVRLTSFYSAVYCVPARVELMTGRYLPRVNLGRTGPAGHGGLPDRELTLAEALKRAGYRTGMAGKWHLGWRNEKHLPTGQGFDTWFGLPYSNDFMRPWVKTDVPLWLYRGTQRIEHPVEQDTLTTRYTEEAVRFIKRAKERHEQPFFFYLAYNMPHLPLHTAERFRGESAAGLYGDVIETIDWSVGRIMQTLQARGLASDTIVVFASDNGPWWNMPERMQQAGNRLWHAGSSGHLRGAKGDTYEGGVRVPAMIRWPGHIPARGESSEITAIMDLYVTFIKAAGGELPKHPVDGHDLMPFLSGQTDESPRERFYYFKAGRLEAMRHGPWKLRTMGGDELYHLNKDVSERFNRASEKPEIVERLRREMQRMAKEVGWRVP